MAHGNPYARWLSPYAADTSLTDVLVPHIPVCGTSCDGAGDGAPNLGEQPVTNTTNAPQQPENEFDEIV